MCRLQGCNALFRLPNLVNRTFDGVNQFSIHLLLIMQEPRTLRGLRHVGQYHHRVIKRMMPKVRTNATIGRERFIFEFVVVNELRFVNEQPRERQRVRRTRAVLTDNNGDLAIIKRHHVFIIRRFRNRFGE